jgi:O-antigen/teichoic acid export membrane protein
MACRGSGVQIPSAPHFKMNISFIKDILRQTKDLIISQFFIAAISLLQVSLVVKILGVEKYGMVTLIVTLPSLVYRSLHSKNSDVTLLTLKEKVPVIYSYLFDLIIGIIAFLICISVLNLPVKNYFGINEIETYIFIFFASKILQTFSESSKAWLISTDSLRKFSLLESLSVAIRFIAIVSLISFSPTVENYIIGQTIYSAFYGVGSVLYIVKSIEFRNFKLNDFKLFIKSVLPHYKSIRLNQIIGLIPQHFDVIIISVVSDFSAVGIFRFAKRLVEPVNYIVAIFNPWLQSKLSRKEREFDIIQFFYKFLLPVGVAVVLFYTFLGEYVIKLIGTEEFQSSYEPLLILLAGYVTFLLTFWIRQYLLFNNLIIFHTYGRVIYTLSFICLSLITSPTYGYQGIAWSLTFAMIIQKLFEFIIYKNKVLQ